MNKNCKKCSLYKPINENKGQCGFWLKEVPKNDYCVEYKEKR